MSAGELVRVRRGVVALPGAPAVAGLALAYGGTPTCLSVLESVGLPLLRPPTRPHIAVPARRGRAPGARGIRLHWTSQELGAVPDVALALAHARACLPGDHWVAAMDAALARGLVDAVDLAAHRPVAGRLAFDAGLRAVDARSGSLPESLLRLAVVRRGMTAVPQASIEGVGRVDLLVEGCVVAEVDGFAYHRDRSQYREDRRRDRVAHLLGLTVARFAYEDVVRGADRAAFEVAELVCRMRGREPGARLPSAGRAPGARPASA